MSSRDEQYPAIPEPTPEVRALTKSVRALKAVVEILTGVRGVSTLRAVTTGEAAATLVLPLRLPGYSRTSLPPARDYKRGMVFVTDGAGVLRCAYSDGYNWRYLQDAGVVPDSTVADGDADVIARGASGGQ